MKTNITHHWMALLAICILQSAFCLLASAQTTAFTYQGQLNDAGSPANGIYDLRFELFDAPTNGVPVSVVTNAAIDVSSGLFTVTLDFGDGVFDGSERWLEIGVRTNGSAGAFSELSPRQHLTAAPYALHAGFAQESALSFSVTPNSVHDESVIDGSLLSADLAPGQVVKSLNGLRDDVELLEGPNISLDVTPGTPGVITLSSSDDWKLSGNVGTTPGTYFLGTSDNQPLELKVNGQRVLRLEPTGGAPNVVGGSLGNSVASGSKGAFIGGGDANVVSADFGTIAGGGPVDTVNPLLGNRVFDHYGTVGGGGNNRAGTDDATPTNTTYATVSGGGSNWATGRGATVGGGFVNQADGFVTTISGGDWNIASSGYATISGGTSNWIGVASTAGVIAGGAHNSLDPNSRHSVIGGGHENRIGEYCEESSISGGYRNTIARLAAASTIAGGVWNALGEEAEGCAIGGGDANKIEQQTWFSTIAGGKHNSIGRNSYLSVIGGGEANTIASNAWWSVLLGGHRNYLGGSSSAALGGGNQNRIQGDSEGATIAGGVNNYIGTNSGYSAIGGGYGNVMDDNAEFAVIPGGYENFIGTNAFCAFAAGRRARAIHEGTFVWADARDLNYSSTRSNEFSIRAQGGVRVDSSLGIKLNSLDRPLITRGWFPFTSGAYEGVGRFGLFMEPYFLTAGLPTHAAAGFQIVSYNTDSTISNVLMSVNQSGTVTATSFNPTSDRNAKERFEAIDPQKILSKVVALPVERWSFKSDKQVRHLGAVAQDFHTAFGLGIDDKHIATVDADGVALAAIQGLNQKLEQKEAKIAKMEAELVELKQLVQSLVDQSQGGAK